MQINLFFWMALNWIMHLNKHRFGIWGRNYQCNYLKWALEIPNINDGQWRKKQKKQWKIFLKRNFFTKTWSFSFDYFSLDCDTTYEKKTLKNWVHKNWLKIRNPVVLRFAHHCKLTIMTNFWYLRWKNGCWITIVKSFWF